MLGIPGVTLLVVGAIGGIGAAGTLLTYHIAERLGDELKPEDLRPMPPPYPPLPTFLYTKPYLVEKLKKPVNEV
jgi:hypothetical protein